MAATTIPEPLAAVQTLADLLDRLGNIPLGRVRFRPLPGTATERDAVAARGSPEKRLCELVDGILVEKPAGTRESYIAMLLGYHLLAYLQERDLGIVLGADGLVRLKPGLVRIPVLAFISWNRLPGGELPDEAIASVVPDLVVEVLSPSNTAKEMENKLREYFEAGVRLAWMIDPKSATAAAYRSPADRQSLGKAGTLDGGELLPGFALPLKKLFVKRPKRRPER